MSVMFCNNCGNEVRPGVKFCPKCGTPAGTEASPPPLYEPPSTYGPSTYGDAPRPPLTGAPYVPPQQKSGCGKILLILGIVLLLIGAGVVAAIYFGFKKVESNIKSSEAYTIALKALKEHPEVIEKMGEIKKTGF